MSAAVKRASVKAQQKAVIAQAKRDAAESTHRQFYAVLERAHLPLPETEYRFHPDREWRMDYAWPSHRIALEVEGGVWTGGRHTRGAGFMADMDKYNAAAALGWRVFRTVPDRLTGRTVEEMLRKVLKLPP